MLFFSSIWLTFLHSVSNVPGGGIPPAVIWTNFSSHLEPTFTRRLQRKLLLQKEVMVSFAMSLFLVCAVVEYQDMTDLHNFYLVWNWSHPVRHIPAQRNYKNKTTKQTFYNLKYKYWWSDCDISQQSPEKFIAKKTVLIKGMFQRTED